MARKQPTNADAFLADLDAKGITYTVTTAKPPASLDWPDLAGPSRQKGKRASIKPDLELAKRIAARRPEGSDVFVVMRVKTQGSNAREHWAAKAKRVADEQTELELLLNAHTLKRDTLSLGCTVTMCRIGRKLDDDNLYGHLKGIRDGIARWVLGGRMGERDSDERIEWKYEQVQIGKAFGVTVAIRAMGAA